MIPDLVEYRLIRLHILGELGLIFLFLKMVKAAQ